MKKECLKVHVLPVQDVNEEKVAHYLDTDRYVNIQQLKLTKEEVKNLEIGWQSEVGGQFAHRSLMFITFYL